MHPVKVKESFPALSAIKYGSTNIQTLSNDGLLHGSQRDDHPTETNIRNHNTPQMPLSLCPSRGMRL